MNALTFEIARLLIAVHDLGVRVLEERAAWEQGFERTVFFLEEA